MIPSRREFALAVALVGLALCPFCGGADRQPLRGDRVLCGACGEVHDRVQADRDGIADVEAAVRRLRRARRAQLHVERVVAGQHGRRPSARRLAA